MTPKPIKADLETDVAELRADNAAMRAALEQIANHLDIPPAAHSDYRREERFRLDRFLDLRSRILGSLDTGHGFDRSACSYIADGLDRCRRAPAYRVVCDQRTEEAEADNWYCQLDPGHDGPHSPDEPKPEPLAVCQSCDGHGCHRCLDDAELTAKEAADRADETAALAGFTDAAFAAVQDTPPTTSEACPRVADDGDRCEGWPGHRGPHHADGHYWGTEEIPEPERQSAHRAQPGEKACKATSAPNTHGARWHCNRQDGHEGDHAALNKNGTPYAGMGATWPQAKTGVPA